jgi:hypothetical protein
MHPSRPKPCQGFFIDLTATDKNHFMQLIADSRTVVVDSFSMFEESWQGPLKIRKLVLQFLDPFLREWNLHEASDSHVQTINQATNSISVWHIYMISITISIAAKGPRALMANVLSYVW